MTQAVVNAPLQLVRPPFVGVSAGIVQELGWALGLGWGMPAARQRAGESQPHTTAGRGGSGPGGEREGWNPDAESQPLVSDLSTGQGLNITHREK